MSIFVNSSACPYLFNTTVNGLVNTTACSNHTVATQAVQQRKTTSTGRASSDYILVVLCFLAVLENLFTCYIIHSNKILRTATNVFVCSLCITDILCAGVLLPLALFYRDSLVYGYFATIIIFTYATNLTAVTYERLVSITKPLRYQSIITKRIAFKITMAAWIIPITYSLLPLTWNSDVTGQEHTVYIIISLLVFLVSPLFFICFVYLRILLEVHRLLKGSRHLEVYSQSGKTTPMTSLSKRFRKAASCCSSPDSDTNVSNSGIEMRRSKSRSVDELDYTLKTDLYFGGTPSESPCIDRQEWRCSIASSKQSCDSGRNNNQRESLDTNFLQVSHPIKGILHQRPAKQANTSNETLYDQPACMNGKIHASENEMEDRTVNATVSTSCGTGESLSTDYSGMSPQQLLLGSGPSEGARWSQIGLDRDLLNSHNLSFENGSAMDDDEDERGGSKMRVGFFESSSNDASGELNEDNQNSTDENGQGTNENDSGIEEERFKDAMMATTEGERFDRCDGSFSRSTDHLRPLCSSHIHPEMKEHSLEKPTCSQTPRPSILRRLRHFQRSSSAQSSASRRRTRSVRRRHVFDEIKASTAFAAVACTYMFTWIPVIYMTFMEVIGKLELVPLETITTVNIWTIAINAAIDPLFYALILRNFRKTIKRHFKRLRNRCG